MILKYVNSKGKTVLLESDTIKIKEGGFHKYAWNAKTQQVKYGDKLSEFTKKSLNFELTLTLRGDIKKRKQFLDELFETTEIDVLTRTPGTLCFGDWYNKCYVISSDTHKSAELSYRTDKVVNIYAPRPFWIKESTILIPTATALVATGLTYPYTYDYTYGENGLSVTFENDHFAACDFSLTAHGPFDNLTFAINANMYEVNAPCRENESITIDTKSEMITKTDIYGNVWNVFGDQNFDHDNFAKIPSGKNTLTYSRNYPLEITVYKERSEPKWGEEAPANSVAALVTEDGYFLATEDGYYLVTEEL